MFVSDVSLSDPTSGAEQVLYQQATGLAKGGEDVYAITRQNGTASVVFRRVEGVQEGCYSANNQEMLPFCLSLFKHPLRLFDRFTTRGVFKAAVCHQPFTCFSLLIAGKLRSIPMIYNFHSPSHEEYLLMHSCRSKLLNFIPAMARRIIEGFCLKRATHITVESDYMKEKVKRIHHINRNRITVNPGGVDLDRFRPFKNRNRLKEEVDYSEGKIHLLTVRNLEPRMGLDNLLKAVHLLKETIPTIQLIIVGEGVERKNLENLIDELRLSNEVTMTGFAPKEILPKYYAAADFFIIPTRDLEGFGLVTPEAMACGTPVLGTPVGGTKEILSKFTPQFIFQDSSPEAMADGIRKAIQFFVNDPKGYRSLRKDCRKYAQDNYSWQRHVHQLTDLINEIQLNTASCNN